MTAAIYVSPSLIFSVVLDLPCATRSAHADRRTGGQASSPTWDAPGVSAIAGQVMSSPLVDMM